jgi:methylenetetrahydrofolate--tRNA-(uracil-5-)-methyltransferase
MSSDATIIGAGLAGCEAAWQLAIRGFSVTLVDMKPAHRTPAHQLDTAAELVCSNSLRGSALFSAAGLLKAELHQAGSLLLSVADETAVPAGNALAVDRHRFSNEVQRRLLAHPRIAWRTERVAQLPPEAPLIVATGPLTDGRFLETLLGDESAFSYYDAIAPLVAADSIDWTRVYRKDRYEDDLESAAYVNCPFEKDAYYAFVDALLAADKTPLHAFEDPVFFEGCLPVEEMARRGKDTLAHGPLKPVGLVDPRTGKRPFAVAQLRQEDAAQTAFNIVGFQTRLTQKAQQEVFRMIPGLENAVFERHGQVHRNTFIDAPRLLDPQLRLRQHPHIRIAGQLSGVEGYVESMASGLLSGLSLACELRHNTMMPLPPPQTALGGIARHTQQAVPNYQPSNIVWAMIETPQRNKRQIGKRDFRKQCAERAVGLIADWQQSVNQLAPLAPSH